MLNHGLPRDMAMVNKFQLITIFRIPHDYGLAPNLLAGHLVRIRVQAFLLNALPNHFPWIRLLLIQRQMFDPKPRLQQQRL